MPPSGPIRPPGTRRRRRPRSSGVARRRRGRARAAGVPGCSSAKPASTSAPRRCQRRGCQQLPRRLRRRLRGGRRRGRSGRRRRRGRGGSRRHGRRRLRRDVRRDRGRRGGRRRVACGRQRKRRPRVDPAGRSSGREHADDHRNDPRTTPHRRITPRSAGDGTISPTELAPGQEPKDRADRARIDSVLLLEALRLRFVREREHELLTRRSETARRAVDRLQHDVLREASDAARVRKLARRARRGRACTSSAPRSGSRAPAHRQCTRPRRLRRSPPSAPRR